MEIRNNMDGLKTLLEIGSASVTAGSSAEVHASPSAQPLAGDVATLSNVGARIQQTSAGSDLRTEKVASVQAALAAGTYKVDPVRVAGRMVETMLRGDLKNNS